MKPMPQLNLKKLPNKNFIFMIDGGMARIVGLAIVE